MELYNHFFAIGSIQWNELWNLSHPPMTNSQLRSTLLSTDTENGTVSGKFQRGYFSAT